MKTGINTWSLTLITAFIIVLFTYEAAQANTPDPQVSLKDYQQLEARIELLEKELMALKKQQQNKPQKSSKKQRQNKQQQASNQLLNSKQLLAVLEKWKQDNIRQQQTNNKTIITQRNRNKKNNKVVTTPKKPPTKTPSNNRNKNKVRKKPSRPSKRKLFPVAGTTKVNLQYSMAETTGRQLSVNGFSLLPIFVVGNIESQDIVSTTHTVSLSINRALANDSQVSLHIPYSQKTEELTNDAGDTEVQTRRKSTGLGDIRMTYSRQIFKDQHKLPVMIGAVTWKTKTGKGPYEDSQALALGSGFNAIRAGVTAIKQDDPAVLFASTGYTANIGANKGLFGDIDPGNTLDLSLGIVYSLTDRLSMSFGLEQAWTADTRVSNNNASNINTVNSDSHTAALSVGAKLKTSPKRFINIRTKIGLNDETPGFQMQMGVPLKN